MAQMVNDKADKQRAVEILAAAFENNRSVNAVVRQDRYRQERIRFLMSYAIDMAALSGAAFLSEDRKACAVLSYSHLKKPFLRSARLDLRLVIRSIGISGIARTLQREKLIAAVKPKTAMAYLWFIGTDPRSQRGGAGSKLLREVLEVTDAQRLPVYLETSVWENVKWYGRFGFEIYRELQPGYTLYCLKREPVND